jgi:hypothetical protein
MSIVLITTNILLQSLKTITIAGAAVAVVVVVAVVLVVIIIIKSHTLMLPVLSFLEVYSFACCHTQCDTTVETYRTTVTVIIFHICLLRCLQTVVHAV